MIINYPTCSGAAYPPPRLEVDLFILFLLLVSSKLGLGVLEARVGVLEAGLGVLEAGLGVLEARLGVFADLIPLIIVLL